MSIFRPLSNKLDQLNMQKKLLIFMFVPFISLTFISINQIQFHYDNYNQAQKSRVFVDISSKLESLVLALQEERGISAAYLGSRGKIFGTKLINSRLATDAEFEELRILTESSLSKNWSIETLSESISVEEKFKLFKVYANKLAKQRKLIDNLNSKNSFDYYSDFISKLIENIERVQLSTNTIGQLRLVNHITDILWLQEYSGRERGAINGLLSSTSPDYSILQRILAYGESQQKLLDQLLSTEQEFLKTSIVSVLMAEENQEILDVRFKLRQKVKRDRIMHELKFHLDTNSLSHQFNAYARHKTLQQKRTIKQRLDKARIKLEEISTLYVIHESDVHALNTINRQLAILEQHLELTERITDNANFDVTGETQLQLLNDAFYQLETLSIELDNQYWWKIATNRLNAIHQIATEIQQYLSDNSRKIERDSISALTINLILIILTLGISLVLSGLILKRLIGEIGNISNSIVQMRENGNYDQKLDVSGDDEVSQIATAYNDLLLQRKLSESQMRVSAAVFEHSSEAILITDEHNHIQLVNPAFTKITGYTLSEIKGRNPKLLQSGRHNKAFYQSMWDSLNNEGHWQSEIWNKRKNGEIFPQFIALSVVKDENNKTVQHISMFSDITQYKKYEEDIWYQANHDALTDLPNRNLFLDRLAHELEMMPREKKKLAVMFIDLDRFKFVNDTYGHSFGDELIATIAQRLSHCLRKSDTVSRFGGDEFTVLSSNIEDINEVKTIAVKILQEVAKPVRLSNGQEAIVSASIGITIYPDDALSVEELVKHADTAMYQAKDEGKNTFCFYMPEMNTAVTEQMQLELELRKAVKNKEFTLHFQPVLSLKDNQIVGAEALLRWQHPDKGLIFPDTFIPRAEETGLIVEIGEQVLEQAALTINLLHNLGFPIHVAVNVSGRQCLATNKKPIESVIANTINDYDLDPSSLKIEITESMLMENSQHIKDTLQSIKDLNVDIYMDDFGTGYSSLSYLKQFPIDVLKIDRSFIWKMLEDEADADLVEAIVLIGRSFNLSLVAEGVETQAHLDYMLNLDCEFAQGYHISKPLEISQFIAFLKETHFSIASAKTDT